MEMFPILLYFRKCDQFYLVSKSKHLAASTVITSATKLLKKKKKKLLIILRGSQLLEFCLGFSFQFGFEFFELLVSFDVRLLSEDPDLTDALNDERLRRDDNVGTESLFADVDEALFLESLKLQWN